MAAPFVGLGTVIQFGVSNTVLVGVHNVAFSGDKTGTEKNTTMATTNGVDTFNSSTTDPGTVDFKMWFLPGDSSLIALEAARAAGAAINFNVIYPLSLGQASFSGIIESITRSLPLEKNATVDCKVKISGPVTATNG